MTLIGQIEALVPPHGGVVHARPRRIDVVVAAGLVVGIVVQLWAESAPLPLLATGLGLVAPVAVAVRRVHPLAALCLHQLILAALYGIAWTTGTPAQGLLALAVSGTMVTYAAVRWTPPLHAVAAIVIATVGGAVIAVADPGTTVDQAIVGGVFLGVVAVVAIYSRATTGLSAERARVRFLEERQLLADEIHDSVAHHMSAIAVRAEAARSPDDAGSPVDLALSDIKRSASTALADMRDLVSALRVADAEVTSRYGVEDLDRLCLDSSDERIEVSLLGADVGSIAAPASTTTYQIAREAITNARRHATGATAIEVSVTTNSTHLNLAVTDDGTTPSAGDGVPNGGHGIRSMTERARRIGGDLIAGPGPDGGWIVEAHLPLGSR